MTNRDDRVSLVEMRVQARETSPLVEQLEAIVEREPGRRYLNLISSERMTSRIAASRYG